MPKLTGKKLKAAKKALRKSRCQLGKVKKRPSRKTAKGIVVKQKPKAGKTIDRRRTPVKLVVSSRPPQR